MRPFAAALGVEAARYGCPLLGGDTVRTTGPLILAITAFGTVPRGRMLPRTGLRPGDRLYVTGTIGDAALGLALRLAHPGSLGESLQRLTPQSQASLLERYLHPRPRLSMVPALRRHATAGMDVSDGLVGDLRKMLAASKIGGRILLANTPLSTEGRRSVELAPQAWETAVTGGDDYELLVGIPDNNAAAFEREATSAGVDVTLIGHVEDPSHDVLFIDATGSAVTFHRESFQHSP